MGRRIHEKVSRLLRERGFKKKELASALGVSPQALQQLLDGTVPFDLRHLKGLVSFFGIKADYWIDDSRMDPRPEDVVERSKGDAPGTLKKLGIHVNPTEREFTEKVRRFIQEHPEEWTALFGPLTREEMEILGLDEKKKGTP